MKYEVYIYVYFLYLIKLFKEQVLYFLLKYEKDIKIN